MDTTTIPERVVAVIRPEALAPLRYRVRCWECDYEAASDARAFVDGYAESHVRRTTHTAEILDRQPPDAA